MSLKNELRGKYCAPVNCIPKRTGCVGPRGSHETQLLSDPALTHPHWTEQRLPLSRGAKALSRAVTPRRPAPAVSRKDPLHSLTLWFYPRAIVGRYCTLRVILLLWLQRLLTAVASVFLISSCLSSFALKLSQGTGLPLVHLYLCQATKDSQVTQCQKAACIRDGDPGD